MMLLQLAVFYLLLENAFYVDTIKSMQFRRVPNKKPSAEPSLVKETASIILCSAICNRKENCLGFGYQESSDTEISRCEIFENENDTLQYIEENNEDYTFYETLKREKTDKFIIVEDELMYLKANDYCGLNYQGILAKISNQKSQEIIEELITNNSRINTKKDRVWIGLDSIETEEQFKWSDSTLLKEGDFQNWAEGEPSSSVMGINVDGLKKCVSLDTSKNGPEQLGKWYNRACLTNRFPFVCQLKNQQYIILKYLHKFDEAKEKCNAEKGFRLAVIPNKAVQKKIERFLGDSKRKRNLWIGLVGQENNKQTWVDGTEITETSFTNWAENEPDYSKGDKICIVLTPENKWRAKPCGPSLEEPPRARALCEKIPEE